MLIQNVISIYSSGKVSGHNIAEKVNFLSYTLVLFMLFFISISTALLNISVVLFIPIAICNLYFNWSSAKSVFLIQSSKYLIAFILWGIIGSFFLAFYRHDCSTLFELKKLSRFLLFFLIYPLFDDSKKRMAAYLVLIAGILCNSVETYLHVVDSFPHQGIKDSIITSLLLAIGAFLLLNLGGQQEKLKLKIGFYSFSVVFLIELLAHCQGRTGQLICICLFYYYFYDKFKNRVKSIKIWAATGAIFFLCAFLLMINLNNRFKDAMQEITEYLANEEVLANSSMGVRMAFVKFFAEKTQEKLLTGFGAGFIQRLYLKKDPNLDIKRKIILSMGMPNINKMNGKYGYAIWFPKELTPSLKEVSVISVNENGKKLQFTRRGGDVIENGTGRYTWYFNRVQYALLFASDDNTDPKTNEKIYTINFQDKKGLRFDVRFKGISFLVNSAQEYMDIYSPLNPHNQYLLFLMEFGVVGVTLYLFWVFSLFREGRFMSNPEKNLLRGLLIAYLLGNLVNSWASDLVPAHLFIIFLAIVHHPGNHQRLFYRGNS